MTPIDVPERIAIAFMTASVLVTLGLGAAVGYVLARPPQATVTSAGTALAPVNEAGPSSGLATPSGGPSGGVTSSGASASGPGRTVVTGGAKAGSQAAASGPGGTAAPGVRGGLITVGGMYDETGPVDATVERDTVRAYFNEVNAAGGVNGYKFQLLDCDSQYNATAAHECSQKLISEGILAIVGWLAVNGEEPETQYLTQQGVPIVGGLGVPSEFNSPLAWPVSANFVTYGTAMGTHAKDLGIHAPGIVLLNVNFIQPTKQALLDALHRNGIQEKDVQEVDATKADYTDIALRFQTEGVDSIIAGLDPFSYARFFQALHRQGFHPLFFGLGLDKKSADQAYGSDVYGAQSLTPVLEVDEHTNDPAMAEYLGAVQKYYPNQVPALDVYSEGQWVAAKLFVEAIRRLGSAPVTRASLENSLNSITNFATGLTVPLSYRPGNHDPNRCFEWIVNRNGIWHTYSDWVCF